MPGGMHDMPEEGRGEEVEVYVVLLKCVRGLYAGSSINSGERFEGLLGKDRRIESLAFGWVWMGSCITHRRRDGMTDKMMRYGHLTDSSLHPRSGFLGCKAGKTTTSYPL